MSAITRTDVEDAVKRFAPNLDEDTREAFVEFNSDWIGEEWDDAAGWDLSNAWIKFQENGKKGHWYTR